ncbi:Dolichyl-diphosphooligosaccharide-protein glycosyltransferase 48kDa subunit [Polychaeton citri CBS 116435]|uniref:Dolichyl-diphosphooligosaccharide--protein glycosyltransferase subunit WBP1 n=1 Tax=Polychaeton citri CBS 116435 TaxID=1314669 RepID=A0A9P4PWV0_9PEZI|nr:Dolichyl-diphosphooligosaccharide-protein glycosyltransferase 48kDa subunit [Polychaeton citri CBS 116435]
MRSLLIGLLLGLASLVSALSATGSKLLVILDEDADKTKYSQFWLDLENRGFQLTYKSPKDSSLSLFVHGEPAYSHLLVLPTKSKGLGPALSPNILVDFINAGSNILLTLSGESAVPSQVQSLLLELDISLPTERTSLVVDHFNYDTKSAGEKHDVLVLEGSKLSKPGVVDFFSVDGLLAVPRAVGQALGNASPLIASILKAPVTAYTHNPKDDESAVDDSFATGSQLSLATAFQARNSARFTVLGSSEMLEDKWFDASVELSTPGAKSEKTANKVFAQRVSEWTFKELGVLRVNNVLHYLHEGAQEGAGSDANALAVANIDTNSSIYRIKNTVYYTISLSAWELDHWAPFIPPAGDAVQLEFSMLSPFHRLNLLPSTSSASANATSYAATFKLPDQHGIFNFYTEYRRPFLTNVEEKRTVTVRHFAHDEWPRSFVISGAYPWISGIWVTVAGWLMFVAVWLYSKPAATKVSLKTSKR